MFEWRSELWKKSIRPFPCKRKSKWALRNEDLRRRQMGVGLIRTLILSCVAGEKIPVVLIQFYRTQHHSDLSLPFSYLPSVLGACPWIICSDLEVTTNIFGKLLLHIFPLWNVPCHQIPPIFPCCIQRIRKKKVLETFEIFRKERWESPSPLPHTPCAHLGRERGLVFLRCTLPAGAGSFSSIMVFWRWLVSSVASEQSSVVHVASLVLASADETSQAVSRRASLASGWGLSARTDAQPLPIKAAAATVQITDEGTNFFCRCLWISVLPPVIAFPPLVSTLLFLTTCFSHFLSVKGCLAFFFFFFYILLLLFFYMKNRLDGCVY